MNNILLRKGVFENAPLEKRLLDKHQKRYLSKKKEEIQTRQEKQKLIDEFEKAAARKKLSERKAAERKEEEEYEKFLLFEAYSGPGQKSPDYYWEYEGRFAPEAIESYKLLGKIIAFGGIAFLLFIICA